MPEPFDHQTVEAAITSLRFANRVRHYPVTDSTNRLAIEAANAGARESVWVADEQTAGRGRGGHTWHSTPGDGIYVSMLVLPWIPMAAATEIPMAVGLATQAAVLEATGIKLDLRWPNDLMIGEKKCGGILVESASTLTLPDGRPAQTPQLRYAVIGVGLNLNHSSFPPEIAHLATSLHLESGHHFKREPILISLLHHVEQEITDMRRETTGAHSWNKSGIPERFTAASTWVFGKRVHVAGGVGEQGGYTGWTRGLDSQGFLRVEDDHGVIRTVLSGGVRSA